MILNLSLCIVVLSTAMLAWRLLKGPHLADRAVALDAIAVNVIAFIVLMSMRMDSPFFFDTAILIAILSFIGTVSIAKYLYGGVIIHRRRRH